ncbi:hypothetical protein FRX31_020529 [Thalictrum thalictroides]|uniref:Uncharacterized protein n=1 Tax=Thalictrum thalictroides TaxID=46969 RepID=A0A7J6W067_THATH|nr:hypothetical protein FRX31_020529 [Thalictrum thalictroides]
MNEPAVLWHIYPGDQNHTTRSRYLQEDAVSRYRQEVDIGKKISAVSRYRQETSYVGNVYVTALSKEIITDDNHILGDSDSSYGIYYDQVSLKGRHLRSPRFTVPSPPISNKGRNWVRFPPPPIQP